MYISIRSQEVKNRLQVNLSEGVSHFHRCITHDRGSIYLRVGFLSNILKPRLNRALPKVISSSYIKSIYQNQVSLCKSIGQLTNFRCLGSPMIPMSRLRQSSSLESRNHLIKTVLQLLLRQLASVPGVVRFLSYQSRRNYRVTVLPRAFPSVNLPYSSLLLLVTVSGTAHFLRGGIM